MLKFHTLTNIAEQKLQFIVKAMHLLNPIKQILFVDISYWRYVQIGVELKKIYKGLYFFP